MTDRLGVANSLVRSVAITLLVIGCGSSTKEPTCETDLDGDGHPPITCGGDDCDDTNAAVHPGLAEEEDGRWILESVAVGDGLHIAAGAEGEVHLVYRDPDLGIVGARRTEGRWVSRQIDGSAGMYPRSIAYGSDEALVLYSSTLALENPLLLARGVDDWSIEDTGLVGAGELIAVSPVDGRLHISYATGFLGAVDLHHALLSDGGWEEEIMSSWSCMGYGTSLAIGLDGAVHSVHWASCDPPCETPELSYTTDVSGVWVTEPISTQGDFASIAFDSAGAPVVAVFDPGADADPCFIDTNTLYLARPGESGWTSQEVETFQSLGNPPGFGFASGPDGELHLAFTNPDGLWYEQDPSPGAEREQIDVSPAGYGGVSVAVDAQYVHVAYGVDPGSTSPNTIWYARRSVSDGIDNDCDGVPW